VWAAAREAGVVDETIEQVINRVLAALADPLRRRVKQGQKDGVFSWASNLLLRWLSIMQEYDSGMLQTLSSTLRDVLGAGGAPEDAKEAVLREADRWGRNGIHGSHAQALTENAWRLQYQGGYGLVHADPVATQVYPYLQYRDVGDSKVRPNHHALDHFIAAADWANWRLVEPPNGFNCRCRLVPIDWRATQRLGLEGTFPKGTAALERFLALGGPDDKFPKQEFQLPL